MLYEFEFMGAKATVITPELPNGKWIWKTEFLYAFDQAERDLLEEGYTRVYYGVSNQYGAPPAIRKMHAFYFYVKERFALTDKCALFGFSRGGLYAFHFALAHPDLVAGIYFDAPVLDVRTWPKTDSREQAELFRVFSLNSETLIAFAENPVALLREYFALGLPTLLVAGGADEVVPYEENSLRMIEESKRANFPLTYIIKPECKHHPQSLEDNTTPILDFVRGLRFIK